MFSVWRRPSAVALTAAFLVFAAGVSSAVTCDTVKTVTKGVVGNYTSISAAVAALPNPIPNNWCINVDSSTFSEQITIQNYTFTYSSDTLTIQSDPNLISTRTTVNAPAASTASFRILNSSVNVFGMNVISTNSVNYGIAVSSAFVTISSVNVIDAVGKFILGGVLVSSRTTISYSSVTVGGANASAFVMFGSTLSAVSYSSAVALGAGGSAFWLNRASSNTFTVVLASAASNYGMFLSTNSSYNTISQSTITSNGLNAAALYVVSATSNSITGSYILAPSDYGVIISSIATYNTLALSSVYSNDAGGAGVYIAGATNTVTGDFIQNNAGYGLWTVVGASGTIVALSTITNNTGSYSAVEFDSSRNQLIGDYLYNAGNFRALWLTGKASTTLLNQTTVGAAAAGFAAFEINSSSNNILQSTLFNTADNRALWMTGGASSNTVTLSTITGNTQTYSTFEVDSSSNIVTQCVISDLSASGGSALLLNASPQAVNNQVTLSSITAAGGTAVLTAGAPRLAYKNIFVSDSIFSAGGSAVQLTSAALSNTISFSTLTSQAASQPALYLLSDSSDVLVNSYVQGSTAVYVFNASATVVGASSLIATAASGFALRADGFWFNLTLTSSVLSAGPQGFGVYLGTGSSGLVVLSTNSIAGAQYGVYVSTAMPGAQVWITSNTISPGLSTTNDTFGLNINGLTTGATVQNNSVYYRARGSMLGFTTVGLYTQSVAGLNIDHNRFSNPGMVSAGSAIGVLFSSGTASTSFKFNDVHSTGTGLTAAYLLKVDGSTVSVIADNIFSSSLTAVSVASVWINVNSGYVSNYNDFFSSNSLNSIYWGALYSFPWAAAVGGDDLNSIAARPLWANTGATFEDFHPLSTRGRWDNVAQTLTLVDAAQSATIDAGDPKEYNFVEPAPSGLINQGSYGGTLQASLSTFTAHNAVTCDTTKYVRKTGAADDSSIGAALSHVTNPVPNNWCITVDSSTYSEQVTISGFTFLYSSNTLTIQSDPTLISTRTTINPPAFSTAAFQVLNSSVNIFGFNVISTNTVTYGLSLGADYVTVSSVNVDSGGKISSAAYVLSGNWDSVSYSSVTLQTAIGMQISGANASVSFSTIGVQGVYGVQILADNASVVISSVSVKTGTGIDFIIYGNYASISLTTGTAGTGHCLDISGDYATIANSAFVNRGNASNATAIMQSAAQYTLITNSSLQNTSNAAVTFTNASFNTITMSTVVSGGGDANGVYINGGGTNTISQSILRAGAAFALVLNNTSGNTISASTISISGSGTPDAAVKLSGSTFNLFTNDNISGGNSGDIGFQETGASGFNTISLSTISNAAGNNQAAVVIGGTLGNTSILQSVVTHAAADALQITSSSNVVSGSTATCSSVNCHALFVNAGSSSSITGSYFGAPSGYAAYFSSAIFNSISFSTMTSASLADPAIYLTGAASNTITNSFISGSTAVYVTNSTNTMIGGSVLVSANGATSNVAMFNSLSLNVTSSTLVGSGASYGLFMPTGNRGLIVLSTNNITNVRVGVFIATPSATSQVFITANTITPLPSVSTDTFGVYLAGLSNGATVQNNSIYFRSQGSSLGQTTSGLFVSASTGVFVNHNRINDPGAVTAGSFIGMGFSNVTNTQASYNDVSSTGTGLSNFTLVQVDTFTSGFILRDNIFFTSVTVSGSSQTLTVTSNSKGSFLANYNDYFSSNTLGFQWGAQSATTVAGWSAIAGFDGMSISSQPYWANNGSGVEDFHPLSIAGRFNPATLTFVSDGLNSATIDTGDGSDSFTFEPVPNGSRANLGSYGNTSQASESGTTPAFTGCNSVFNVRTAGGTGYYSTIGTALAAVPSTLSGYTCVIIRDGGAYAEQVFVGNFNVGTSSISIFADPASGLTPTVNPPPSSTAAFVLAQSSVSVMGINIAPTNAITYGVFASSANIGLSSVNVQDAGGKISMAGVAISSYSTISYSSVTAFAAHSILITGSSNSVSFSSVSASKLGKYGLYVNGGSYNQLSNLFISSGVYFNGGAVYNSLSFSTVTSVSQEALVFNQNASSNTVTQSYFSASNSDGVAFYANAGYNVVSLSTAVGNASVGTGLRFAANNDAFAGGFAYGGTAVLFTGGTYNTVSFSTAVGLNSSSAAMQFTSNSSSNTVSNAAIIGAVGGKAFDLDSTGNHYNAVNNSTLWTTLNTAARIADSDNTMSQDVIVGIGAGGGALLVSGSRVSINQMTLNSTNNDALNVSGSFFSMTGSTVIGANYALNVNQTSSSTITQSYLQGSTAVYVNGSTGTVISASVLIATNTAGDALWMGNGSRGLSLTSSALYGASQGTALRLDRGNFGLITISTNNLYGGQFGISVGTQTAAAQVWITSNTFLPPLSASRNTYGLYLNGLTSGATIQNNGVYYRSPGSANSTYGLYAQSAAGVNIDHNRISNPGMVTGGNYTGVQLIGVVNTTFKFNDVYSTGSALTNAYLLSLTGGSTGAVVKDNIFSSSMSVTGSSATIRIDAASQTGFAADYNDYFSSNSFNSALCAATSVALSAAWTCGATQDSNSIRVNPLWPALSAGVEDFHPLALLGRFNPVTNIFVNDAVISPTIDAADPAEPVTSPIYLPPTFLGGEQFPNSGIANQGSYGQTDQASKGPSPAKTWTGNGGDNNWYTPANWSPVAVPGPLASVTID